MDTLIKVTNDTLGIENVTAVPSATASVSTLGLSSQVNQYYSYKEVNHKVTKTAIIKTSERQLEKARLEIPKKVSNTLFST